VNGGEAVAVQVPPGEGWGEVEVGALPFMAGTNVLVLKAEDCLDCRVRAVEVGPSIP